jgi:hypothetical protein
MPKFRIEPFKAEHFKAMDLKNEMRISTELMPDYELIIKKFETNGPAMTLFIDDKIIGSAGFLPYWPGVAEVWALVTPLVHNYPLEFCKFIKKNMESVISIVGLSRVQATVKVGDQMAVKFLQFLGFKIEGLMRKFGPDGSDNFMMGRV